MTNIGKTKMKRGRPATGRDPSVTIRLPEDLQIYIDRQAAVRAISRSEMIRMMVEESALTNLPGGIPKSRTAYHEAGHAVIARVLGVEVFKASVKPSYGKKPSRGRVLHEGLTARGTQRRYFNTPRKLIASILIAMAGRAAEDVLIGFPSDGGDNGDVKNIEKWLSRVGDRARFEKRFRKMSHMLVWRHADAIRRVAAHLVDSETLKQDQIDRLISNSEKRASPALCMCCKGGISLHDDAIRYLV
jgi:hypothetical protein